MKQIDLKQQKGFSVLHSSTGWRTACHNFDAPVNGVEAFKEWGIHEDSEEAFVLLNGCCFLVTCDDSDDFTVIKMEPFQLYVVDKGEKHAIVLTESTSVFIVENDDMSRFQTIPMDINVQSSIKKAMNF